MRFLILALSCLAMLSCDYFDKKKITTEEILEEEMKAINWKDVDEYPTFSICDSATNKKVCFENVLRNMLNRNLLNQNIVVTEDLSDTVVLQIQIDKQGRFSVANIKSKESTREQIPKLDSILLSSFDSLPKIYPAIKRSQHVATEFNLPVIVNIK